jgi:predicted MPP superfamily phosphohydrolase
MSLMRLLFVLTILISGYCLLGFELIAPLETQGAITALLWLLLFVPFTLILWLPLVFWRDRDESLKDPWYFAWLLRACHLCMGGLSFLLFFSLCREGIFLAARLLGFVGGLTQGPGLLGGLGAATAGWIGGPSRLPLFLVDSRGSALLLALGLLALMVGLVEGRRLPRVNSVTVGIEGLAPGLEGMTIAQISDLHVGETIRRPYVQGVVDAVNALTPDLIALTGDIADGEVSKNGDSFAPLAGLRATLGRFYVTGNHEYYWDADPWVEQFRKIGITPLLNSYEIVKRQGASVVVAGVLDMWAEHSAPGAAGCDPVRAIQGAPADASLRILLSHRPKVAIRASTLGYDLQLSGHTHGGQFLPWTILVRLFEPFARGLHRVGRMWLYVNRGTGSWGPRIRLGSPSEITYLTLKKA